jgi:hypothetical protein
MLDTAAILKARDALLTLLGPELTEVIDAIRQSKGDEDSDYHIRLPTSYDVDKDVTDLMSYVARSANVYGRMARLAGLTRAQVSLAEGVYKQKYKDNLVGSNREEREANALRAARDEHSAYTTVEGISKMAEAMESAARITSESARKLLDKVQAMQISTHREAHGSLRPEDYRPY